jgi:hypothetical protein
VPAAPRRQGTSFCLNAAIDRLVALATRGRVRLAHGTGRLTIHAVGRQLGVEHGGYTTAARCSS